MNWDYVANFSIGSAVLAGLVGLLRYRWLTPALRFIALLAIFTALLETTGGIIMQEWPSNLFLFPAGLLVEIVLFTLAYRQALASPTLGRWLLGALVAYVAFLLAEVRLNLGTDSFYVAGQVVSDVFTLGLAALYFRKLLNELHVEHLRRDPFFWLSVALLTYSLGDMFTALSSDYIVAHYSVAVQQLVFRGVRNFFNIELYAAFLAALLLRPARQA